MTILMILMKGTNSRKSRAPYPLGTWETSIKPIRCMDGEDVTNHVS